MGTIALDRTLQLVALGTDATTIVVLILAALLSILTFRMMSFVGAAFATLMRGAIDLTIPVIAIAILLFLLTAL